MEREENKNNGQKLFRTIFGIFMIIIYVGMGVLLLCGVFNQDNSGPWVWIRWGGGSLLVVYGFWRAYRQFKGIDSSI